MKTFLVLFGISCLVASAVLIMLTRDGIAIRSAPIIAPSPQGAAQSNVAKAIVNRLFPDFQMANYIVIGSPLDFKMGSQIVNDLKFRFEKQFQKNVSFLSDDGNLSPESLIKCPQPCWILTSETHSNELSEQNKLPQILDKMENTNHFQLTLIPFSNVPNPSDACIAEKRLSLQCLIPLSIHQVSKKFKDPEISYFFMRKYQDRDYFLFLQTGALSKNP